MIGEVLAAEDRKKFEMRFGRLACDESKSVLKDSGSVSCALEAPIGSLHRIL